MRCIDPADGLDRDRVDGIPPGQLSNPVVRRERDIQRDRLADGRSGQGRIQPGKELRLGHDRQPEILAGSHFGLLEPHSTHRLPVTGAGIGDLRHVLFLDAALG